MGSMIQEVCLSMAMAEALISRPPRREGNSVARGDCSIARTRVAAGEGEGEGEGFMTLSVGVGEREGLGDGALMVMESEGAMLSAASVVSVEYIERAGAP